MITMALLALLPLLALVVPSERIVCRVCQSDVAVTGSHWRCRCGRSGVLENQPVDNTEAIVRANAAPPGALAAHCDIFGNRSQRSYRDLSAEELKQRRDAEAQEVSRSVFRSRTPFWEW